MPNYLSREVDDSYLRGLRDAYRDGYRQGGGLKEDDDDERLVNLLAGRQIRTTEAAQQFGRDRAEYEEQQAMSAPGLKGDRRSGSMPPPGGHPGGPDPNRNVWAEPGAGSGQTPGQKPGQKPDESKRSEKRDEDDDDDDNRKSPTTRPGAKTPPTPQQPRG